MNDRVSELTDGLQRRVSSDCISTKSAAIAVPRN